MISTSFILCIDTFRKKRSECFTACLQPSCFSQVFSAITTRMRFTVIVELLDLLLVFLLLHSFNHRNLQETIVTRSLERGGGGSIGPPPPCTFDTIHPIELKFGTYNKLHLYFQLSETTWCLIGFHGNNSQINDVTGGRLLVFSNFQILFKFSLLYLRLTGKPHLAFKIHEIVNI